MKQKNYLKLIIVTVFFALCYVKSIAQTGTISGIITDDNGLYVPGANVYIESIKPKGYLLFLFKMKKK